MAVQYRLLGREVRLPQLPRAYRYLMTFALIHKAAEYLIHWGRKRLMDHGYLYLTAGDGQQTTANPIR